jgi:Helix-turn-helix domain
MRDFAERLAAFMAERGLGVRALARHVPCDPALISRAVNGKQPLSPQIARRLDDVLGAGGELADLAAAAAVTAQAGAGELELIELARRAEASDMCSATQELLDSAVDRLCRAYPVTDAVALAASTRKHLRQVTRLLDRRVTLAQHRDLLVTAGWLSALLACCAYDAGDRGAAETARVMTRQFGDSTGHAELVAWSWEIGAWMALVEGRYHDTVTSAEAGLTHAGVTSAAVQLALQAARGYARMGDRQAREALKTGRALLAHLPAPDHPEHHFVFDTDKYEFYVATVLTWLGDDDHAAEEHARHVIAGCQPGPRERWPMRMAISQLDLAVIAARRGDLDEATILGTLALGHARKTAQVLPRAVELGHILSGQYPKERLVTGYREAIEAQHPAGSAR